MMRLGPSVFFRLSIAALGLSAALSGPAHAQQKSSLRLDWTALGYHAPFYLGVARGYYREVGIDLSILEGKGSPTVGSLVGNGSDDFGFADASTIAQLISQGLPAKMVMGIFQKSTLALFYPEGKGISKPADLKGKRILLCPTDGLIKYLPAYLKSIGLSMDDVKVNMVDCGIKYTYLAQGNADVAGSYGTAGRALLQSVGFKDIGKFDYADAGINLPSHGIVVSTATIQTQPDKIRHFIAATTKAWQEARSHPDAAVNALIEANPLQKGKEAQVKETLLASFQYIETPGTKGKPFGWQSPDEWKKATELLVEATGMKSPSSPEAFYTNDFIGK
ncbi:MAG TPA: ABC transporter substrate-binding protein [Xanthobacteraceae bacterium]